MLFQGFKISLYCIGDNERIQLYDFRTCEYHSIDWEGQFSLEHIVPCLERLVEEARKNRIEKYQIDDDIPY